VLGIEPAIGTQTNLQTQNITLSPPTSPCPDDPRPPCVPSIGVPCTVTIETTLEASVDVNHFNIVWSDPLTLTYAERRDGEWSNRLNAAKDSLVGGPQPGGDLEPNPDSPGRLLESTGRRTGSYPSTDDLDAPYANQASVVVFREFMSFDTSMVPLDATIISITLRLIIQGNDTRDDYAESVLILPSTHDGDPENTDNFDKFDTSTVLAEFPIADAYAAGPDPPASPAGGYIFDVTLDPLLTVVNRTGPTRFAAILKRDADPTSVLPSLGIFGGLEVTPTSPAPDDQVHVAAGTYDIGGTVYVAGTFVFAFEQTDVNGGILSPGEVYHSGVVIDASGTPVVVKGEKGTDPPRPAVPPNTIVLAWVQCSQAGTSFIQATDISGFNSARHYTSVNVNETRSDASQLFLGYGEADQAKLIVRYRRTVSA